MRRNETGIRFYKMGNLNIVHIKGVLGWGGRLFAFSPWFSQPTIPFAQKHLCSNFGKTEAYIILSIRDDVKEPYIYMGFQYPPAKASFKRMIEEQDSDAIFACFEKIPITPGDVFMVPDGMPHAIGEGACRLFSSSLSYPERPYASG